MKDKKIIYGLLIGVVIGIIIGAFAFWLISKNNNTKNLTNNNTKCDVKEVKSNNETKEENAQCIIDVDSMPSETNKELKLLDPIAKIPESVKKTNFKNYRVNDNAIDFVINCEEFNKDLCEQIKVTYGEMRYSEFYGDSYGDEGCDYGYQLERYKDYIFLVYITECNQMGHFKIFDKNGKELFNAGSQNNESIMFEYHYKPSFNVDNDLLYYFELDDDNKVSLKYINLKDTNLSSKIVSTFNNTWLH